MSLPSKFAPVFVAAGLAAATGRVSAQGVMNAVDTSGTVFGSATTNAVGWSFTPTVDIAITTILASANQVSFWSASSQLIGSYGYTGPYGTVDTPPAGFQSIAPLFLAAGQDYYIFAQNADQSAFFDYIFGPPSGAPSGPDSFVVASGLTYRGGYTINSTGQWTPILTPPANANYFLLGPSFQFTYVPEPAAFALLALGVSLLAWPRLRKQS